MVVTVVGVALFAFIIGDLLNSGNSLLNSNQNNVVVINGNAVDYQGYMNRENELIEIYKFQAGTSNLSESYMNQIRQSVYDEIVMENIMIPRLDNLGITVTADEMKDLVEGENISPVLLQNQMFQNPETRMFDRNSVIMFLNNIKNIENYPENVQMQLLQGKAMWMFLEKNIKQNRLSEKYANLLTKAIVSNSLDAKDAFNNSSVSSDIAYVMEPFSNVADSTINVSAAEIEKLYNQRKEMFRQQETCVIDYIAVDVVPSAEDYNTALAEMEAIREELETTDNVTALTNEKSERKFINAFFSIDGFGSDIDAIDFINTAEVGAIVGPTFKDNRYRILTLVDKIVAADSVDVSMLSVAPRTTDAETRIFADSLLNVIKGGADFTELVMQYSVDQLARDGGEMGWVTEVGALQALNEEFRKTAFSLSVGQSAVVKSNYGLHIIKLNDKTKNVTKYKVADIAYTVTPSSATRNFLYNSLNQFIAKNNSAEKFAAAAKENGYDLISNAPVFSTDMMIGNITSARQIVRWAFNGKKGDVSEINECDDKFVAAVHKGRLPKGYQSLASVTPQLRSELAIKKKGEEIAANLKAKNLSSIPDYAEALNTKPDTVRFISMATSRITNIGVEPKLNAMISLAQVNAVSQPIAGDNGVYIFEVTNRVNENAVYDEKREISMLEASNSYRIGGFLLRHLQQNADIEDNRIRFY